MRIIYLGTGEIGLPVLRWLLTSREHEVLGVVTQPDKPTGRKQEMLPSPIKQLALAKGLPVWQPPKIREPGALAPLAAAAPEVLVVMAYGQILPKAVLTLPTVACLNLHASLLPRHRGAAPIQASIVAGEAESGLTVMYMDEGLDTGAILLQRPLKLRRRETGGSLHDRLGQQGPEALGAALRLLQQGQAPFIPQENALATHAPKLERAHGELDWTRPVCELERRVRAWNPWPGAYTWLPGAGEKRKLKVHSAIVYRKVSGAPGTVLRADRHGLLVAAGTGALLLRTAQLEGKRRMPVGEILLGNPVPVGTPLGS